MIGGPLPRAAHRGWNVLKGTKPQERCPINDKSLAPVNAEAVHRSARRRSGRSSRVCPVVPAVADCFGQSRAVAGADAEAQATVATCRRIIDAQTGDASMSAARE